MLYTNEQVQEQKERFNEFIANEDLMYRIGKMWIKLNAQPFSEWNGIYTPYAYIHRVLRVLANVQGAMYHPDGMKFYSEILTAKAVETFVYSIGSKVKTDREMWSRSR